MAVYFLTGKLGSGKTLCAVGKIRDYLEQGRAVATNLDINLDKLLPAKSKQHVTRLPDKPRLSDMEMLGKGCVDENENKYGAIVLDELGTWFNTRNWNDKSRLPLIDWFLHARKMHWDVFFIVQDIDNIDKQLRNSLCEHLVICKRTDRLSIPLIGPLLKMMGFDKVLPKIHVASVFYGDTVSSIKVGRWWYRGQDLYQAYDTAQIFTDDQVVLGDELIDFRTSRTLLSPFFLTGQKLKEKLQLQLNELNGKKTKTAAPTQRLSDVLGQGFGKPHLLVLCVLALAYNYFSSPDETIISEAIAETAPQETLSFSSVESLAEGLPSVTGDRLKNETTKTGDYFLDLIQDANVKIGLWHQNNARLDAVLIITKKESKNNFIEESLTLDDLRVLGWLAIKRGDFLFLHKEGFEKTLTYKLG